MPELPEVQTITTDLHQTIEGSVIKSVKIVGSYRVFPDNATFTQTLTNQKIIRIFRIAKNICFELSSKNFLVVHLAMTGQLLLKKKANDFARWERIIIELDGAGEYPALKFCDMRMFGKATVLEPKALQSLTEKYGPEPIDDSLQPETFLKQLKSKNTTVKNVLLEQTIVAGLGNIYATDSLFLANIHPETPTKSLNLADAVKLLTAAKQVLLEGIAHRGSTLGDKMYIDAFGQAGSHQDYFKIYGKKNCPECHAQTVIIKINGRSTYLCPVCQPVGKQISMF